MHIKMIISERFIGIKIYAYIRAMIAPKFRLLTQLQPAQLLKVGGGYYLLDAARYLC